MLVTAAFARDLAGGRACCGRCGDCCGGYRTGKLIGSNVVNDKDKRIGVIDDTVISRDRVLFAVLQVGGFRAVGAVSLPCPTRA